MTLSETMFIILTAFLVGYCSGYYLFELLKYKLKYKNKKRKFETEEFLLAYNKQYGLQQGSSNKTT